MKAITHYRYAGAAFLLMVATASTSTAMSFINQPAAAELNVGLGTFTVYYSLLAAAGAFLAPAIGQLVPKIGLRTLVGISAVWGGSCLLLFSLADALWMFYLIGMVLGMLSTTAVILLTNVILQTHYSSKEAASLLGLVMSGSGIGGALYSSLLPAIIEGSGWRVGCRIVGCIWFVLLAIGYAAIGKENAASTGGRTQQDCSGWTRAEALRSVYFYFILAAIFLTGLCSGIVQHYPAILVQKGFTLADAGILLGIYNIVLTTGKIIQGFLYGKWGIKAGTVLSYAFFACGSLLLALSGETYPAMMSLAIGFGVMTILPPLITKMLYGSKEYAGIYGIVTMCMSVGGFLATPLWGTVYDLTGRFQAAILAMPVLLILSLFFVLAAIRSGNAKAGANSITHRI